MDQGSKGRRVVLYAVAGLAVVEVPLVHLIVSQLSALAAWVVTGLTVLTFGWLLATAARGVRLAEQDAEAEAAKSTSR